jgi:hypothetical protein
VGNAQDAKEFMKQKCTTAIVSNKLMEFVIMYSGFSYNTILKVCTFCHLLPLSKTRKLCTEVSMRVLAQLHVAAKDLAWFPGKMSGSALRIDHCALCVSSAMCISRSAYLLMICSVSFRWCLLAI